MTTRRIQATTVAHDHSFATLFARLRDRATKQGTGILETAKVILREGLDSWDRIDAGKRRPRVTAMRPKKTYSNIDGKGPASPGEPRRAGGADAVNGKQVRAFNKAARRVGGLGKRSIRRVRKKWARRGHPSLVIGQPRIGRSFQGRKARPSFKDTHVPAAAREMLAYTDKAHPYPRTA